MIKFETIFPSFLFLKREMQNYKGKRNRGLFRSGDLRWSNFSLMRSLSGKGKKRKESGERRGK